MLLRFLHAVDLKYRFALVVAGSLEHRRKALRETLEDLVSLIGFNRLISLAPFSVSVLGVQVTSGDLPIPHTNS